MNDDFLQIYFIFARFCEFQKLFKKIKAKELLVGASSQAVGWFKSYLSGRRQYVRIGSTVSSFLPLSHGVPQVTILSPLLFCIYTNDIPAIPLSSNIDSYVDDSKLFLTFSMKDIKQTIVKLVGSRPLECRPVQNVSAERTFHGL